MADIETNQSLESLIGRVAGEFCDRLAQGGSPEVEEYARQHPEIADHIRRVFPALLVVGESSESARNAELSTKTKQHHQIGEFRILRELGRGGMGVVYEAEQSSIGRRVALKVLPFAAISGERSLQRFQNEVRAAATLDHRHIVPVYSVGEERGIHYYSMKLIRGQSLAQVIKGLRRLNEDNSNLDGSSISRLASDSVCQVDSFTDPFDATSDYNCFDASDTAPAARRSTVGGATNRDFFRSVALLGVQAAEALEHAHQRGVIHRDIKPGNLLLDCEAELFVTDFGLARVEADAGVTMTGDLIGTLRYMSPEQALAKRVLVDNRADIYSLGATLYELITLHPAIDGADRQELLKRIAFHEPRRPRAINRAIPLELETIVCKAMAKEPNDRYSTATDLAEDLERFLDDRPIAARPPSLLARTAKWSRRNSTFVVFSLVTLLISTIALAVSVTLIDVQRRRADTAYTRENEQRQQAELALDKEEIARKRAESVLNLLVNSLRSPDPKRGGYTLTVAEMLSQAESSIQKELIDEPELRRALFLSLGQTYLGLGLGDEATRIFESLRAECDEALGDSHPKSLSVNDYLAKSYQATGRYVQAIQLHTSTLEKREVCLGQSHPDTLTSMRNLATAYMDAGRYLESVALHEKNLRRTKAVRGEQHPETLISLNQLAIAYGRLGRGNEAVRLLESAHQRLAAVEGETHRDTLVAQVNLAVQYLDMGRHRDALRLLRHSYEELSQLMGPTHVITLNCKSYLVEALKSIGNSTDSQAMAQELRNEVLRQVGTASNPKLLIIAANLGDSFENGNEKISFHKDVLDEMKSNLGDHHPSTHVGMENLANAYLLLGRWRDGIPVIRRAIELKAVHMGQDHPETIASMLQLAIALNESGRRQEAVEEAQEVVARRKAVLGANHPKTLRARLHLGKFLLDNGQAQKAVIINEAALDSLRTNLGEVHPDVLRLRKNLGLNYKELGKYEKSLKFQERTLQLMKSHLGNDDALTMRTMRDLASAFVSVGRNEDAIKLCNKTLDLQRIRLGEDHDDTLDTLDTLTAALHMSRRHKEAIEVGERHLELRKAKSQDDNRQTLSAKSSLALDYMQVGEQEKAMPLFEDVAANFTKLVGADHPLTLTALNNLANGYLATGEPQKAHEIFEKLIPLRQERLGKDHPETLRTQYDLAQTYAKLGKLSEAIELQLRTLKQLTESLGDSDFRTVACMGNLGWLLWRAQQYDRASQIYQKLVEICRDSSDPQLQQSLFTYSKNLATNYNAAGHYDRSFAIIQEFLPLARTKLGDHHPLTRRFLGCLAQAVEGKTPAAAESILRISLEIRKQITPDHWLVDNEMSLLGASLTAADKFAEAEPLLISGYQGLLAKKDNIPVRTRHCVANALQRIVELYCLWEKPEEYHHWAKQMTESSTIPPSQNSQQRPETSR